MMAFSFNTFFGYENQINSNPDQVLIYSFAGLVFGVVFLLFMAILLRKLSLTIVNSYFINPLMLALGLTFLLSILPTVVFYVVTLNISFVKIIYCWITIFIGMLFFVGFNLQTIKSFFSEFGKITEQEEFRNRKR